MQSQKIGQLTVGVKYPALRTHPQHVQRQPLMWKRAETWARRAITAERIAVAVLMAALLVLGGTVAFSLYQALLNYRVF